MVCQILFKKQPIILNSTHIWEHETLQQTCIMFVGCTSEKIMHWDCCLCHVPFGSLFKSFLMHHFLWTTNSHIRSANVQIQHVTCLNFDWISCLCLHANFNKKQIWTTNLRCSSQNIRVTCPLAGIELDFSQQTLFQI